MAPRRCPLIAHGFAILLFFFGGIGYPLFKNTASAVLLALLFGMYGSVWIGKAGWLERLDAYVRQHAAAPKALLLFGSVVVTFGGIEYLGQFLTRTHVVDVYSPMLTQVPTGTEDWRVAHITADEHRVPDPVLWWRPIDRSPYNSLRMKGPEVTEEKPAKVFRILCYGDSNTDGPGRGSWPERLQEVLERGGSGSIDFEVLNAGVAGYSSHQGLLRFRQQVNQYRPDLVLVSFGWNDVATALGAPDKAFRPPRPPSLRWIAFSCTTASI